MLQHCLLDYFLKSDEYQLLKQIRNELYEFHSLLIPTFNTFSSFYFTLLLLHTLYMLFYYFSPSVLVRLFTHLHATTCVLLLRCVWFALH